MGVRLLLGAHMIHATQLLTFELGKHCNFSERHKALCPLTHMPRSDKLMTDDMIIDCCRQAYFEMGFEGLISWHFYNEPMLYWRRMLKLMVEIRDQIPQSRFFLWTNGSILIRDHRMNLFEASHISNYDNHSLQFFLPFFHNPKIKADGPQLLDNRLEHYGEPNKNPCRIMFDNFLIACDGEVFICCHDWRNEVKIGNLFDVPFKELDARRWEYAKQIAGNQMTDKAHDTCIRCNQKWPNCGFDPKIAQKAFIEIQKIPSF